jgi:hypothetical protein
MPCGFILDFVGIFEKPGSSRIQAHQHFYEAIFNHHLGYNASIFE